MKREEHERKASGATPFHRGELEAQDRSGVRDVVQRYAPRFIRPYMPDEHRAFYEGLRMLLVGSVTADGQPIASVLFGRPGFASAPDEATLEVAARPITGDPLEDALEPGAAVGILGIELKTRRRNRVNGRLAAAWDEGFSLRVAQSYGNCPQHIRARAIETAPDIASRIVPTATVRTSKLDAAARDLVSRSDAFFIASAFPGSPEDPRRGADISHRGGAPGFVRLEDDSLVFPDFGGNGYFNTIGNILVHPQVGLLFFDFARHALLQVDGRASIVWEDPLLSAFEGAERFVRVDVHAVRRFEGALPLSFGAPEASANEAMVGTWRRADEALAARSRDELVRYRVVGVVDESETIRSLHLRRTDGEPPPPRLPGQYLPVVLDIPGEATPVERTYTISNADPEELRLSIKRDGVASRFLHDRVSIGASIEARAPRGQMVLDETSERPLLLVSAGVGVTPMVAIVEHLARRVSEGASFRRTFFIHAARRGGEHAFGPRLRHLAQRHEPLHVSVAYSRPDTVDRLGVTHDVAGHLSIETLRGLVPPDDYDAYLCGPPSFMNALYPSLKELGVDPERIRLEAFGPASLPSDVPADAASGPVAVRFARSQRTTTWTPGRGSLLDLAEAEGVDVRAGCRVGACGLCATSVRCGAVTHAKAPSARVGAEQVVICTAVPRDVDGCGGDAVLVLDL